MNRRDLFKLAGKVGLVSLAQQVPWSWIERAGLAGEYLAEAASLPTYSLSGSTPRALSWNGVEKVLLEDFDDGHANYTKESGSYTDQTEYNLTGAQSVKLELAAGQNASLRKAGYGWDLSKYWGLGVKFYLPEELCETGDHASISLQCLVSTANDFTNYYLAAATVVPVAKSNVNLEPGWNFINFAKSDFSKTGTHDWATSTYQMVRIRATLSGGTGTKWFVIDSLYGVYGYRPQIRFSFDDGALSQYDNALPIMNEYGLKGTCFVVGANAGQGSTMSAAQMRQLQDTHGWTIGSHTYSHTAQTSQSLAAVEQDIVLNQRWLQDNGLNGWRYFAYPQGEYTFASKAITSRYHDLCRASLAHADQHKVWKGNELQNKKNIRIRDVADGDAASVQIAHVNTAIALGESADFNFHNIKGVGETGTGYSNAAFRSLCQYLYGMQQSNVLDVPTYADYDRSLQTARWRKR